MRHLALPFFCAIAVGLLLALLAWALRNQVDAVALACAIGAVFFAWRCWEDSAPAGWPSKPRCSAAAMNDSARR